MLVAIAKLLISSLVCFGLLSAWAATSPRHWFVRTGVLVAAISLLLLIPAYEPVVVFAMQGLTVAAGVQVARWWGRRKERHGLLPKRTRFSLATVLLVTVYVAITAAVIAKLPELNFRAWQSVVLIGFVSGLATLLGLWMVHGRSVRWWLRVVVGLVLALGISLPLVWGDWFLQSMAQGYGWPRPEPKSVTFAGTLGANTADELTSAWIPITIAITAICSCTFWLLAGTIATRPNAIANLLYFKKRWKRVLSRGVLFLLAFGITAPSADICYQLMTPLPIPQTMLPPNSITMHYIFYWFFLFLKLPQFGDQLETVCCCEFFMDMIQFPTANP